jgi:hypothetical protein
MEDYSQFGETTILYDLVNRVLDAGGDVPPVAVEIGAGDGYHLSNIRGLMQEHGWDGWQYDFDPKCIASSPEVVQEYVNAENVNDLTPFQQSWGVGILSIDVDGNDYWIWKALRSEPCLVVIEFNPTLAGLQTIPYDPKFVWNKTDNYFGASFGALRALGRAKGYKLLKKTHCNLIFVHHALWHKSEPFLEHEPDPCFPPSSQPFQNV